MTPVFSALRLISSAVVVSSLFVASAAAAPDYHPPDYRKVRDVEHMIQNGRCAPAFEALKPALKARQPEALLLAGSMYEEGVCVAANWDKAVQLYTLADQAGNPQAIPHLVAGFARPGRDNDMALWWAMQSGLKHLPPPCVPNADPDDPDGFGKEVERMPVATLQACVYLLGVVAELSGNAYYPPGALSRDVSGVVTMEFDPAEGVINWHLDPVGIFEEKRDGNGKLAKVETKDAVAVHNRLIDYLKTQGEATLKRYPRPPVDFGPGYTFKMQFVFEIR